MSGHQRIAIVWWLWIGFGAATLMCAVPGRLGVPLSGLIGAAVSAIGILSCFWIASFTRRIRGMTGTPRRHPVWMSIDPRLGMAIAIILGVTTVYNRDLFSLAELRYIYHGVLIYCGGILFISVLALIFRHAECSADGHSS